MVWLYTTPQPAHTEQAKSAANEFLPENLDRALTIMGVALPESKEEFNFQVERWVQRLINRVIRYEGEIQSQESHTEQDGWIEFVSNIADDTHQNESLRDWAKTCSRSP